MENAKCEICGKSLKNFAALDQHRYHFKDKPFKCIKLPSPEDSYLSVLSLQQQLQAQMNTNAYLLQQLHLIRSQPPPQPKPIEPQPVSIEPIQVDPIAFPSESKSFLKDLEYLEADFQKNRKTLFPKKIFIKRGQYDNYRKQTNTLNELCAVMKAYNRPCEDAINAITRELSAFVSRNSECEIGGGSVLFSLPGGEKQCWHRDYRRDARLASEPIAFLIPLSECNLDFRLKSDMTDSSVTAMQLGSLLMFRILYSSWM